MEQSDILESIERMRQKYPDKSIDPESDILLYEGIGVGQSGSDKVNEEDIDVYVATQQAKDRLTNELTAPGSGGPTWEGHKVFIDIGSASELYQDDQT